MIKFPINVIVQFTQQMDRITNYCSVGIQQGNNLQAILYMQCALSLWETYVFSKKLLHSNYYYIWLKSFLNKINCEKFVIITYDFET